MEQYEFRVVRKARDEAARQWDVGHGEYAEVVATPGRGVVMVFASREAVRRLSVSGRRGPSDTGEVWLWGLGDNLLLHLLYDNEQQLHDALIACFRMCAAAPAEDFRGPVETSMPFVPR